MEHLNRFRISFHHQQQEPGSSKNSSGRTEVATKIQQADLSRKTLSMERYSTMAFNTSCKRGGRIFIDQISSNTFIQGRRERIGRIKPACPSKLTSETSKILIRMILCSPKSSCFTLVMGCVTVIAILHTFYILCMLLCIQIHCSKCQLFQLRNKHVIVGQSKVNAAQNTSKSHLEGKKPTFPAQQCTSRCKYME